MQSFKVFYENSGPPKLPIEGDPLTCGEALIILSDFYDVWNYSSTLANVVYGGRSGVTLQETQAFLQNRVNSTFELRSYSQSKNFGQDPTQLIIPIDLKKRRVISKMVKNGTLIDWIDEDPEQATDDLFAIPNSNALKQVFNAYEDPTINTSQWPNRLKELVKLQQLSNFSIPGLLNFHKSTQKPYIFVNKSFNIPVSLEDKSVKKELLRIAKTDPVLKEYIFNHLIKLLKKSYIRGPGFNVTIFFIKNNVYNDQLLKAVISTVRSEISNDFKWINQKNYSFRKFDDYINILNLLKDKLPKKLIQQIEEYLKKGDYNKYYQQVIMKQPGWQPSPDDSSEDFDAQADIF